LRPVKHLRWFIVWVLFASTVINYISRQTLSVLAPVIIREFHLSHADYSHIVSAFQISYAIMFLLGGILVDIIGPRLALALAIVWWSLASVFTSFANSILSFGVCRFLLGVGEGCNWPGAGRVTAEWFPARERGIAVGIYDSGSSIGAIVAPPLVAFVAATFGWRYAFVASGILGFLWLILWLIAYRPLETHPAVTAEERALIERGRETPTNSRRQGVAKWVGLLKQSNVWGVAIGRAFTDPIWWFYVFWLPQYLSDVRGFSLKQIGMFAWIPFLASDLGNLTGGFCSAFLIKRGMTVIHARKWVCVASSVPILAGIPAALTGNAYLAIALISIAVWGYASWSTMGLTLPCDLFPQDVVASVTGLSGLTAGIAGTAFTLAVGVLVDKFSYFPAFAAAAFIPLLGTASVLTLIRDPKRQPATGEL
jgi:ACS family hexuronate transporter-like MFS transporter